MMRDNNIDLEDYTQELNKKTHFLENELKLNSNELKKLIYRFDPIIKIKNFTQSEFKTKIYERKKRFEKEKGVFDLEIFKELEIDVWIKYIKEYYRLITWSKQLGRYGDYYFFQMQTKFDFGINNPDTLIISKKNDVQLRLHFKMILETLEEFELENTTKDKPNTKEFNWMKVVQLFTDGIIYNERNKKPPTSFTKIIKENLSTSHEEAEKLRPYVSETFSNLEKPKNDKNLCLPEKAKIIKKHYETQFIDPRFLDEINKASKYQEY